MLHAESMLEEAGCSLCGSDSTTLLFQGKDRQHLTVPDNIRCAVRRCNDCRMTFLSPRVAAAQIHHFYPSGEYYTRAMPTGDAGLRRRILDDLLRMQALRKFGYPSGNIKFQSGLPSSLIAAARVAAATINPFRFRRILPFEPNGRLFELGFGDGYYLRLMKDMGWECWGTELDLKIVEAHQSLGINAFTKLSDNEIPRNYFHWVTAYHVLEHVYDPVPTLEKMFKMLKHGGRIYIGVPNMDGLIPRLFRGCWYNLGVPVHPQQFSAKTLVRCLRNAGFQDIRLRHRSLTQGLLGSIQFALNDILWRATGHKRVNMFLRDNRLCQVIALPFTKLMDAVGFGDAIEVTARKI